MAKFKTGLGHKKRGYMTIKELEFNSSGSDRTSFTGTLYKSVFSGGNGRRKTFERKRRCSKKEDIYRTMYH